MKRLFIVVMMVALTIALAQVAPAQARLMRAIGGGYIASECGGDAIATFGFFAKPTGQSLEAKGEFQYSDLGCDTECRNIHAEIIYINLNADSSVSLTGRTDEGYLINVVVYEEPIDAIPQFQIVVSEGASCSNSKNLLAGNIKIDVK